MDQNDTPKDTTEKEYTPYVSARLRSKMEDRYEEEEKGPGATIAVVGLIAVIVICGGLFLLSSRAKKAEPGQTAEASQTPPTASAMADSAAYADSLAALAAADSMARAASTPTTPTPAAKPIAKPGATPLASGSETPSTPAPAAAPARYGIVVGSYLFDDKAGTEKDRLAGATSLDGAVIEKVEGGTSTYQVVLGSFESRAEAEAKGAELLGAGTVKESRVITLKRR